jgi:putative oxidoreductase
VINISSIGARAAFPPADYGAAKAALTNLSKALAEEFGPQGLRALTVSPGPTRTQNWGDPRGYAGELAAAAGLRLDEFLAQVPATMGITTGRLTEPEETAALITFLPHPGGKPHRRRLPRRRGRHQDRMKEPFARSRFASS